MATAAVATAASPLMATAASSSWSFSPFLYNGIMIRAVKFPLNERKRVFRQIRDAEFTVSERRNKVRLCMAIPGIQQADLRVSVHGNDTLTIGGTIHIALPIAREGNAEQQNNNPQKKRRRKLKFVRSFLLDTQVVDKDRITANLTHGVLTVSAPKMHFASTSYNLQDEETRQEYPNLMPLPSFSNSSWSSSSSPSSSSSQATVQEIQGLSSKTEEYFSPPSQPQQPSSYVLKSPPAPGEALYSPGSHGSALATHGIQSPPTSSIEAIYSPASSMELDAKASPE